MRSEIYANRTHVLACNSVKGALLAFAAPLVLDRFINVVSRCFFEFEANCMNNLAAGSTDVNQEPLGRLGHMIVGSATGLEKRQLHIYCSNVFLTT